jgi:hypothetical protein
LGSEEEVRGDTDRLIELAGDLGQRVNSALQDVIPPEAHAHLLKAQKELLTALFLIYERQLGARRQEPQPPSSRTSRPRRASSPSPRPSPARGEGEVRRRVQRIEIE